MGFMLGMSARVVQLLPSAGPGHNLVEVWDEQVGWVVVDPTRGGVLGADSRPASAARLAGVPESVRWFALARAPAPTSLVEEGRKTQPDPRLYEGQIFYPEPWLYLRVGRRSAPWPFRGSFACLGGTGLGCGRIQELLRVLIPACGLASLWLLGTALWNRRETAL